MLAASGTPGMDDAAVEFFAVGVAALEEVEAGDWLGALTRSPFESVSILALFEGTSLRFLPLSEGLLLVLPLGRPGPRLSGSCCVPPLEAVVVVVVVVVEEEEAAEPSFFRRIRAKGRCSNLRSAFEQFPFNSPSLSS